MLHTRHHLRALLLIAGCEFGSIGGPGRILSPPISVTGTWNGETTSDFGSVRKITLVLQQVDHQITGQVSMTDPGGQVYFVGDADGVNTYPEVSFTLTAEGYETITATGRLTRKDTMTLVLDGSGWNDTPLTMRRSAPSAER
jgi:hypothetical protein